MKKQILTAAASLAVVAAMSVSALATELGDSNGYFSDKVNVKAGEAISIEFPGYADSKVVFSADAFGEGVLEVDMSVFPIDYWYTEDEIEELTEKLAEDADAEIESINTYVNISAYLDNVSVEPDGTATVTIAKDNGSNAVIHRAKNGKYEVLTLTVKDDLATFETKSFSPFYLVTLATEGGDDQSGDTGANNNAKTGVVLAVVPAIAAAAAIVVSKKRK